VPVAERKAKAMREVDKLRKKGKCIQPVEIEGRTIAASFWGKGWCDHLESLSDYENRLPRGRTYVRNGSVCHLEIKSGNIEALVSGTKLYKVNINIKPLNKKTWQSIKKKCSGQIGTMLELLQGKISKQVMTIVSDRENGLFPLPGEMKLDCSCPDWAVMCKHVAAVLYGVGARLDTQPDLLFILRGVDASELISSDIILPESGHAPGEAIAEDQLGDIFGIDIDMGADTGEKAAPKKSKKKQRQPVRAASSGRKKKPAAKKTKKKATAKVTEAEKVAAKKKTTKKKRKATPVETKNKAGTTITFALNSSQPTGKSVARLRKKLGLTVDQFAAKAGVSPASIIRWESAAGKLKLQERSLKAVETMRREAENQKR
jgi:uncharacterized Zn finger protein